jgi:hypothetical protein
LCAERLFVLTLDRERRFTGAHPVLAVLSGDAGQFAEFLFAEDFLRGVPEFLLIISRPKVAPQASSLDKARVRALILAGRASKCELLDALIVGKSDAEHSSGVLPFRRLPGFSAANPFSEPAPKARNINTGKAATK